MSGPIDQSQFDAAIAAGQTADAPPVAIKIPDAMAMQVTFLKPYIMTEILRTHKDLATKAQDQDATFRAQQLLGVVRDAFDTWDGATIDKFLQDEHRACIAKRNQGEPVQYIRHLAERLPALVNERYPAANAGDPAIRTLTQVKLENILADPAATRVEQRTGGFTALA